MSKPDLLRCTWCGKDRRAFSEYEQREVTTGEWKRLCRRCANRRLNNPYNALLQMRRITQTEQP